MDDISGAEIFKYVYQRNLAYAVHIGIGTLLGFVLGYIVGIVNDVKLNDGDNIVKRSLSV